MENKTTQLHPSLPKLAVCAVIVNPEGKFLSVSRKDNHAKIGLPGGKVDSGENVQGALKRELQEETGLTIQDSVEVFSKDCGDSSKGETVYHTVAFFCKAVGKIQTQESGVVSWVRKEDLIRDSQGAYTVFGQYNEELFQRLDSLLSNSASEDFVKYMVSDRVIENE